MRIICVVGRSKSGKTALIERLVPELKKKGLRIAVIKHDPHDRFEFDREGKDSWRFKKAGADAIAISSPKRIGIIMDVDHDHSLEELSVFFDVDLIIAEGYKRSKYPKIEVIKKGHSPLLRRDELIAVVSEEDLDLGVPRFSFQQIKELAEFILTNENNINFSP